MRSVEAILAAALAISLAAAAWLILSGYMGRSLSAPGFTVQRFAILIGPGEEAELVVRNTGNVPFKLVRMRWEEHGVPPIDMSSCGGVGPGGICAGHATYRGVFTEGERYYATVEAFFATGDYRRATVYAVAVRVAPSG